MPNKPIRPWPVKDWKVSGMKTPPKGGMKFKDQKVDTSMVRDRRVGRFDAAIRRYKGITDSKDNRPIHANERLKYAARARLRRQIQLRAQQRRNNARK